MFPIANFKYIEPSGAGVDGEPPTGLPEHAVWDARPRD